MTDRTEPKGRLHGKAAIVTGAATGIGEAIAHTFVREGARVVVNGLVDDPVDDVVHAIAKEYGDGTAVGHRGDVSSERDADACVRLALDTFGRLDVLVNNAGVFLFTGEVQDYDVDAFDRTVRMNVRSAFLMTKYAIPHLQRSRGVVLAAGSEAGTIGIGMNAPYGGTKAFIHAFIRGVAHEQAKYGVRANVVAPGPIDTAWTHKRSGPMNATMEKTNTAATPLGRLGTAAEVANVYAFLASDEASFVTGAIYAVDGGITIGKGPVGEEAGRAARKQPDAELRLEHTHDGLRNKDYDSAL
jgi:NAD(P)-dependent dehydrogenase (short-subunit alcohol dehydrogenase family)